ncbi:helix-turn-helix domain-containing protein [Costertonia aggregata]|uniref:Helix-turn-helix transcriptional regulator n=1 Tax=Costertonia aggregata TaxID=343403 RepID=A0A7H9ANZ6_9FLAO|nr:helix-turn-helix transcriptional regulator [Costertonia aggregata]QLG44985.1 helix-turn-helix transcriptional regulator [Costertonia aggregata]
MKTIELKTNNLEQAFNHLKNDFGGTLEEMPKEYSLEMNNDLVKGEITGVSITKNISFIEYDVTFNEDTLIIRNTPVTNPIYFLYCAEGQMSHSFGINGKQRSLNQFQTGIFASDPSRDTCLFFRKDQAVKLSSITVNTHASHTDDENLNLLQEQLLKTFMPKEDKEIFAYTGSYNLKIAEKMQQLETIKQGGIVRRLLIKGIVHMMLALEIEQHNMDMKNSEKNFGSLTRSEMDTVHELSNFIQNYPEVKYTLAYLSKKAGMSPAKLQEGFKLLHNRTVSDYIRNVRVETAENLIKTTDLNISEIVYTVGLTSRSYFSKIFKQKYNCSPKYYQDHQNSIAVTA